MPMAPRRHEIPEGRRSWLLRRENGLMQAVYARRMWRLPPDPSLAEALAATRRELATVGRG
jgi:hypothetical protein